MTGLSQLGDRVHARVRVVAMTLIALVALFPQAARADGQLKGTVSLTVRYAGSGEVYYEVWDKAQYERVMTESEGEEGSAGAVVGSRSISAGVVKGRVRSGVLSCQISDLRPGTYMINVFADENGNGFLDEGLGGPSEPWGMSVIRKKPLLRAPRFDEVSFSVSGGESVTMEVVVK